MTTKSSLLHLFDFDKYPPSIERLPAALTANSITKYPTFRYKGGDASAGGWAPWGYGSKLTLRDTLTTYNQGSPLLGPLDDSVMFNGDGYFISTTNIGNITTEDFVVEILMDFSSGTYYSFGNYTSGSAGWLVYVSASVPYFYVNDGTDYAQSYGTAITGQWVHLLGFYKTNNRIQLYQNGVAVTNAVASSVDSITTTNILSIGASVIGAYPHTGHVSLATMWKGASWLDSAVQDTVAKTRFAQLTGVYPQLARGTALPTVMARTTAGYLDKREADGTTKLYYVAPNWPRSCSRLSGNSSRVLKGYLSESGTSNTRIYSETFNNWSALYASVPATAVVCPDGVTRTTCTLHEDATAGQPHLIYLPATTGTCFSVYAKAVNRSWIRLSGDSTVVGWFNVSTGVVGTYDAASVGIIPCGNGWYRCWVVYAGAASNASLLIGSADNTATFNGLNQNSLYIFGAQVEAGNYPSSYIPTTTITVARGADSLRYKMNDGNLTQGQGSVSFDFLAPNINQAGAPAYWYLSDGGIADNYIGSTTASTGDDFPANIAVTAKITQALITGSVDIWNGNIHNINSTWINNSVKQYVDGVADGAEDTSCTIPVGLTQLDVGAYFSAGYEVNGLISNFKVGYPVAGPLFKTLDVDNYPPSIERLPAALTINGITVNPTFRYNGKDATATTWPAWTYGETLTLQAGTAPTYNNGSPLLGSLDDGVKFNAGGYYKAATNAGDITTEDFVVEIIFAPTDLTINGAIFGTYGSKGWMIYQTSTDIDLFASGASGAGNCVTVTPALNQFNHLICFFRNGASCGGYINGVYFSGADVSSFGSLTSATTLFIGGGGYGLSKSIISYAAMWKQSAWLDTHLQATVAKTRFAQLTGMYPTRARGTALPSVMARTTAGYLDKVEADGTTKLYYVGANWPRTCSRKDTTGKIIRGYLSEVQATNNTPYSAGPATSWSVTAASYTTSDDTVLITPNGQKGCVKCIESASSNRKNIYMPATKSATTVQSVYVYPFGGRQWCALETWHAGGTFDTTYFDMINVVVGTTYINHHNSSIKSLGNGWYRIQISFATADTGDNYIRISGSADGTTCTYAGDITKGFYFWGAQVEAGVEPTSSIPTTTAPVTRTPDSLRYVMSDGNLMQGKGSLTTDFIGPNYTIAAADTPYLYCISDNSNLFRIEQYIAGTTNTPYLQIRNTSVQVAMAGATNVNNGNKHTLRTTWNANQAKQYTDSAIDGTESTACIIPVGLLQLDVGAWRTAGAETNGLISNVEINYPVEPVERSFAGPLFNALDFDRFPPSIANLPAGLTINGVTKYPTFRYKGGDANGTNWKPWGYGETAVLQAGTAPSYNCGSPLLGPLDDGVKGNGGGYYNHATLGEVTATNDIVFEAIFVPTANLEVVCSKRINDATYKGWLFYTTTGLTSNFNITQSAVTVVDVVSAALIPGCVYHFMAFIDRSGSGQIYINGVASGGAVNVSSVSDCTTTGNFEIFSQRGGANPFSSNLYYVAMWQGAAWLDTHLQATVAKTRFAQLTGVYPQQARGTALPSVIGSASPKYLDKREAGGITKLYYVGGNWPRVCSRINTTNSQITKGYISEILSTNYCLQSQAFGTTWAGSNTGDGYNNIAVSPDGMTTASEWRERATNTDHYIWQGISMTSGTIYLYSCWLKASGRTWAYLEVDKPVAVTRTWFNLSTGVVGTTGADSAGIENWGNGWYRCWVKVTAGSTATGYVYVGTATADNTSTYLGTKGLTALYMYGAQVETGISYPTSYIPTTTVSVARAADSLRYVMNDGNLVAGKGSLSLDFWGQNINQANYLNWWTISDASTNRMSQYTNATGDEFPTFAIVTSATLRANVVGSTDVWNGDKHTIRATWENNSAKQYVDGVADGTEDIVCAIPTGLTQLDVGAYYDVGYEPNGLISNIKIFGLPTKKG